MFPSSNKVRSCFTILLLMTPLCLSGVCFGLQESPPVPPEDLAVKVRAIDQYWIELTLPDQPFSNTYVGQTSNYSVTSSDDPTYAQIQRPIQVNYRYWPECAWYTARGPVASYNAYRIHVFYRIYLRMENAMMPGKTYQIGVNAAVGIDTQYSFNYNYNDFNPAIRINQVAYQADGPKVAYLSWWTGQSSVQFSTANTFWLLDVDTGELVYQGTPLLQETPSEDRWSRSYIYSLNFSNFTTDGNYVIYIPTVGVSYPFEIRFNAFNSIGYTSIRGMTMLRDGDHGLDDPTVTHWHRPPAHLDDAIDEYSGQSIELTGGHMDAGDRGHYPHNAAGMATALLSACLLFPDEIERYGEALDLPESGNGIPDFLDETIYELDWIYKALEYSSRDGGMPYYLRPVNQDGSGGYEMFKDLSGVTGRKFYTATKGPNRHDTLYCIGALAMAANTPLLRDHDPVRAGQYEQAAIDAFANFELHHPDDAFWLEEEGYDPYDRGPHRWSDEMLIAAANLYELTGETKYLNWLLSELPTDLHAVRRWDWDTQGPWIPAFLSIHLVSRSGLSQSIRDDAREALIFFADDSNNHDQPYGAPLISDAFSNVGWYFTGSMTTFPNMIAYGLTGEESYRVQLIKNWNYMLGTNALSRSFISGLGQPQRRPRWQVLEIGQYQWTQYIEGDPDGWSEIPPGILSADIQKGDYAYYFDDSINSARKNQKYPAVDGNYPASYRYHDSWNVYDEFTIVKIARTAASVVPLLGASPGNKARNWQMY